MNAALMTTSDPFTLERFVEAQASTYANALAEIRRGSKRSHWMWFVFPQLVGLGRTSTAQDYAIGSLEEARAYLEHRLLGLRYMECVGALQDRATSDPVIVFGALDAMKLRSSLSLFEAARPHALFAAALDRWFGGEREPRTLQLLAQAGEQAH